MSDRLNCSNSYTLHNILATDLTFKFVRDNEQILRQAGILSRRVTGSSAKEVKALNLFDFSLPNGKPLPMTM